MNINLNGFKLIGISLITLLSFDLGKVVAILNPSKSRALPLKVIL
jgi:hypothetical protein